MEIKKNFQEKENIRQIKFNTNIDFKNDDFFINRYFAEDITSQFILNLPDDFSYEYFKNKFVDFNKIDILGIANPNLYEENRATIPLLNERKSLFQDIYKRRYSCREFKEKNISFQDLSNILSFLKIHTGLHNKRLYPSAGNIYPVDLYIYVKEVDGASLNNKVLKYQPFGNNLVEVNETIVLFDDLFAIENINSENINIGGYLVINREKIERKYGERGFLFAMIEVGEIIQALSFATALYEKDMCVLGGYKISKGNEILKIDGINSVIGSSFVLG